VPSFKCQSLTENPQGFSKPLAESEHLGKQVYQPRAESTALPIREAEKVNADGIVSPDAPDASVRSTGLATASLEADNSIVPGYRDDFFSP